MTTCSISCRLVVALVALGCACGVSSAQSVEQSLVANSNQTPAGHLANGRLTVRLEAAMGEWSPEEHDGPSLKVAAFREEGRSLSTPGPLLRVPEGTEIDATVTNRLDLPLTVHGLHGRPGDAKNVVVVPPGENRKVSFLAGARGTNFYWASRNGAETTSQRRREDGQLNGAFIVEARDGTRPAPTDRILMITDWIAVDDDTVQPPRRRELFTFNGRSWPHTERFTYRAAEEIHWRIINAASSNHPLHLHGFYFRVDSVGDAEADTTYADDQRRMVVTELVRPGRTFTLTWTAERIGNWLFHCHVLPHTSPQQRYWKGAVASLGHDMSDHARDGMAGLVVGVTILPNGTAADKTGTPPSGDTQHRNERDRTPGVLRSEPGDGVRDEQARGRGSAHHTRSAAGADAGTTHGHSNREPDVRAACGALARHRTGELLRWSAWSERVRPTAAASDRAGRIVRGAVHASTRGNVHLSQPPRRSETAQLACMVR